MRKTLETHDLVHAWLAARQEKKLDQLASLTAVNAVWHSPVEGPQVGRSALVDEIRCGFEDTDRFESRILDVHCHGETSATARIRNIAIRHGKHLDSVQTLYLQVKDGAISAVRIEVDDPAAVESFWS
jgi:ketosteroid isomerase-like protein